MANQDPFFGEGMSSPPWKTLPAASRRQPASGLTGFNWSGCEWLGGVLPRGAAYGWQANDTEPPNPPAWLTRAKECGVDYMIAGMPETLAAPLSSREGALELPRRTRVHASRRRPRVSLAASRTRSFCVCPRRSLVSRDCLMSLEAHFCQSFSQQLVSRPVASSQNGRNCQHACASFLRDSCGRRFPWHTNASECILWRGRGRKQLCSLFLGFVCHRSCSVRWEATRVRCFSWWSTGKWVNHKAAP